MKKGNFKLGERRNLICDKCQKITPHEYIRDMATNYWRCEICVNKILKNPLGVFIPPHIDNRNQRANFIVKGRNVRSKRN